jgi:hypothetical protein
VQTETSFDFIVDLQITTTLWTTSCYKRHKRLLLVK